MAIAPRVFLWYRRGNDFARRMSEFLKTIFDFVIWVLVPFILLVVIWYVHSLKKRMPDHKQKDTIRAGFWAGVILFFMVLIYQVGIFLQTGFPENELYQGFNVPLAIVGAVASFFAFSGGKRVLPPELLSLIVLVVTFVSLWGLLHYLFIRTWNEPLLSLILGMTFGMLVHFATSPSSIHEFLRIS